jgi:hypothetical protein
VLEQQQKQQRPTRVITAVMTERSVLAAAAAGVRLHGATVAAGHVIEFPEHVHFEWTSEGYQVRVGETCIGLLILQSALCPVPWLFVAPDAQLLAA